MSPSSSAAAIPQHIRHRASSNATPVPHESCSIKPSRISSRPGSPGTITTPRNPSANPPNYTVFIRLPFRRGDFQDPAPVNWNASKDRQLWKLISKSHSGDLNWEGLSHEFGVELNFLLMQAAWLSERHMERMRRQVERIGGVGTPGESATGSGTGDFVGGVKMERGGSRGTFSSITTIADVFADDFVDGKIPAGVSAATFRRGSPSNPLAFEVPHSPVVDIAKSDQAAISRTPSYATVTQSKVTGSKPQPRQRALRGSSGSTRKPTVVARSGTSSPRDEYYEDALEHEGPTHSDDSEDEPPSALARSQAFRRPPPTKRPAKPTLGTLASDGDGEADSSSASSDDDDSNAGYLPFAAASKTSDPAATLRGTPKHPAPHPTPSAAPAPGTAPAPAPAPPPTHPKTKPPTRHQPLTSSLSSASTSSAFAIMAPAATAPTMTRQTSHPSTTSGNESSSAPPDTTTPSPRRRASHGSPSPHPHPHRRPHAGPLSPRYRAHLASLSPRTSEGGGSPSMGSSFSDLDDASVTQSALEEALMSNMRAQGGSTMVGRMSILRDALGGRRG